VCFHGGVELGIFLPTPDQFVQVVIRKRLRRPRGVFQCLNEKLIEASTLSPGPLSKNPVDGRRNPRTVY